jgi:hypothetical protein
LQMVTKKNQIYIFTSTNLQFAHLQVVSGTRYFGGERVAWGWMIHPSTETYPKLHREEPIVICHLSI